MGSHPSSTPSEPWDLRELRTSLSVPPFPHLENGDGVSNYLMGRWIGLHENTGKVLAFCLISSPSQPGVGNGNPLQYSCLGNPMDRGAWRATVHRGTKTRTRLKRLSTHAHTAVSTMGKGLCLLSGHLPHQRGHGTAGAVLFVMASSAQDSRDIE